MKAMLLWLLASVSLVAAWSNCYDAGYFCGKELRLKYQNIYWCQDIHTNPHVVVDNCYDECISNPDRNIMPACVKPDQDVLVSENPPPPPPPADQA